VSVIARTLCAAAAFALLVAPSATASKPLPRQAAANRSLAVLQRAGLPVPLVVRPVLRRALTVDEPALAETYQPGIAWEWQWADSRVGAVPERVLREAAGVKVAVIDSGADVSAPDLADKAPRTWSVLSRSTGVRDRLGHGTFVSSLATGSVTNGTGISGFGGDAQLLVVQAIDPDGYITDVDEAAAIVYAVTHGAKIINLSIGGEETSAVERRAIHWAARRGVLIVAAAGNEHDEGNLPEYPAALLQPLGSHGRGGIGLAVGATSMDGSRAYFSNTGSYLSLAAPGYNVFAAESADSPWPRAELPWASPGYYGWASGTSFASPEVAGVAALVWAANPRLTAQQVAKVLKQSATGTAWNRELGWGRLDAASAVQLALETKGEALRRVRHEPRPIHSSPPS
jgi:subtilisin family serine protease